MKQVHSYYDTCIQHLYTCICTVHVLTDYISVLSFSNNCPVSETDQIVRDCVRLVTAYQSLHSSDTGLDSLPKIASAVEECSEELRNAISSTTDR